MQIIATLAVLAGLAALYLVALRLTARQRHRKALIAQAEAIAANAKGAGIANPNAYAAEVVTLSDELGGVYVCLANGQPGLAEERLSEILDRVAKLKNR